MKKVAFLLIDLSGGGGERVMLDLANESAASGIQADLILLEKKGSFIRDISPDVNVITFNSKRFISAILPLVSYLRRHKPDAVIATAVHMQVVLMLAKMIAFSRARTVLRIGIPLSIRFQNFTSQRDKLVAKLAHKLFKKADALVPNSKGLMESTATFLGIPREKFTVIHNPVRLEKIVEQCNASLNHPWFAKKDTPVIVAAGRLREQKDFATLIRALPKLSTKARLIVLGSGSELEALRRVARDEGVGASVEFAGFVENPQRFMSRADVFVLSSLYEGFPNVLVEAMTCGTPVVSTDCDSGPREIVAKGEGDRISTGVEYAAYGVLVPTQNPSALAEALDTLLKDAELREKYQKASRERAADFSMEKIIKEYKQVLGV